MRGPSKVQRCEGAQQIPKTFRSTPVPRMPILRRHKRPHPPSPIPRTPPELRVSQHKRAAVVGAQVVHSLPEQVTPQLLTDKLHDVKVVSHEGPVEEGALHELASHPEANGIYCELRCA